MPCPGSHTGSFSHGIAVAQDLLCSLLVLCHSSCSTVLLLAHFYFFALLPCVFPQKIINCWRAFVILLWRAQSTCHVFCSLENLSTDFAADQAFCFLEDEEFSFSLQESTLFCESGNSGNATSLYIYSPISGIHMDSFPLLLHHSSLVCLVARLSLGVQSHLIHKECGSFCHTQFLESESGHF